MSYQALIDRLEADFSNCLIEIHLYPMVKEDGQLRIVREGDNYLNRFDFGPRQECKTLDDAIAEAKAIL